MALIQEILTEDGYEQCKRCASYTFHVRRTPTYIDYECSNCGAGIRTLLVDPTNAVTVKESTSNGPIAKS